VVAVTRLSQTIKRAKWVPPANILGLIRIEESVSRDRPMKHCVTMHPVGVTRHARGRGHVIRHSNPSS
jgi:hypothetical protein